MNEPSQKKNYNFVEIFFFLLVIYYDDKEKKINKLCGCTNCKYKIKF